MDGNRLLVVDDDPLMASLLGKAARMEGFEVIATDDPADLRTHVRRWRPTAVALDMMMPGLDGLEALLILKEEGSAARILIVSGVDDETIEAARLLGARSGLTIAGVLIKPFETEALVRLLREVRDDREKINAAALSRALANSEFRLEYQPKIDVPTRRPIGVEALLRWDHPALGLLPPSAFLSLVQGVELTRAVTVWLIGATLAQKAAWLAQGIDLDMAINLSARDFTALDVAEEIERGCTRLGIPPEGITLEITETAATANPARIAEAPRRLPGIRLAIDDLGTGYSSLVQLRELPFSEVKIDQYFVSRGTAAAENMIVVRAIIDLAHSLGKRVAAEGVETEETLRALADLGCDAAQGFLISPAMPGDRIPEWVGAWRSRQLAAADP